MFEGTIYTGLISERVINEGLHLYAANPKRLREVADFSNAQISIKFHKSYKQTGTSMC